MIIYSVTVEIPVYRSAYPVRQTYNFDNAAEQQHLFEVALRRGMKATINSCFTVTSKDALADIEAEISGVDELEVAA